MIKPLVQPPVHFAALILAIGLTMVLALTSAGCGGGDNKTDVEKAADQIETGLKAHEKGDLAKAREAYVKAIELDPNNKFGYYNLALINQTTGEVQAAEPLYRLAVRIDPQFASALYNLGLMRNAAGDSNEAMALLQKVIELEPSNAGAHYNLGLALRAAGESDAAEQAFTRAIELDPRLRRP